ncbi:MAG: murein hydrolase activator EnvC family protein [Burkholderiaceae bacterium]
MQRTLIAGLATLLACAGLHAAHAQGRSADAKKPAAAAPTAPARKAAPPPTTPQAQRRLQAEQRELQARLAKLKRQLAQAEATRSEAADALAESERAISAVNRRLRELSASRQQIERQIVTLRDRSRAVNARQSEQERQLALVLQSQFALAQRSPWQSLIDGDSPDRVRRDLGYLDYVVRAQVQRIEELGERRRELAELEAQSRAKQAELAAIAEDERMNRAQLVRQQAARKQTLAKLARQIAGQRQSIATLERDDQRLAGLIENIGKILAEQARRAEERARRREAAAASGPRSASPASEPQPQPGTHLARLRGRLLLPVEGEVVARFGSPRRTEAGVDGPTWKGVFIRAAEGAEVHAAAAGRVVFADWLRGFGNLLIVDHGESALTVYGNNETLLASVGDRVEAGAVIAQVGNTGGSAEAGLYFEIRIEGRPVDPLKWIAAR